MVKRAQNERQSAHRTHWAAQFAVASELCKRRYQVALTMGTHPVIDLMVVSPKGITFLINVKGQYKKHSWPVRLKKARGKLFYVLAFVPEVGQNRFFILTQEAVENEIQRDLQQAIVRREARGLLLVRLFQQATSLRGVDSSFLLVRLFQQATSLRGVDSSLAQHMVLC